LRLSKVAGLSSIVKIKRRFRKIGAFSLGSRGARLTYSKIYRFIDKSFLKSAEVLIKLIKSPMQFSTDVTSELSDITKHTLPLVDILYLQKYKGILNRLANSNKAGLI
jgi:hypothetical protein